MKFKTIFVFLGIALFPILLSANSSALYKQPQTPEKSKIIKIKNTGKIISYKQMEKLPPKSIQSIDVYPDSIIITLKSKSDKAAKQPLGKKR